MTLCSSFLVCLCLTSKNTSSIVLLTAAIYHSSFLLFGLVDDFSRVASSILIQATMITCMYTLIPTAYQYYRVAVRTQRYVNFWFAVLLNITVPFLYILTTIGTKYTRYLSSATELWLFVVLVLPTFTCTLCVLLLSSVIKRNATHSRPILNFW